MRVDSVAVCVRRSVMSLRLLFGRCLRDPIILDLRFRRYGMCSVPSDHRHLRRRLVRLWDAS